MMERFPNVYANTPVEDVAVWYFPYVNQNDRDYFGLGQMLSDLGISYVLIGEPGENAMFPPYYNLSTNALLGHEVVIVPEREYITEEMAEIFKAYVDNGGILICYGNSSSTSFESYLNGSVWYQPEGATGYTIDFQDNCSDYLTVSNRNSMQNSLSSAFSNNSIEQVVNLPTLKGQVNSFAYTADDNSMIIHFINYDYNEIDSTITPVSQGNIAEVKLPNEINLENAIFEWITPEISSPVQLQHTIDGDTATVILPSWHIWGVLKIGASISTSNISNRYPMSEVEDVFEYDFWNRVTFEGVNPLNIKYQARDEDGIKKVDLYYRYSSDNINYGDWCFYDSIDLSSSPIERIDSEVLDETTLESLYFNFSPNQDGYYQFYTIATDSLDLTELKIPKVESTPGYDSETAIYISPEDITVWQDDGAGLVEKQLQSGIWQTDVSNPVFTWEQSDSLAPIERYMISLQDEDGNIVASGFSYEESFNPSLDLVLGTRYSLTIQPREMTEAMCEENKRQVFYLYYGELPVEEVTNVEVTTGNGLLLVDWDIPTDERYDRARIYWRQIGNYIWDGGQDILRTDNSSLTIQDLLNDTPYEIMIIAINDQLKEGNQVIYNNNGLGYTPIYSNLDCDTNNDNKIDILDLKSVKNDYGLSRGDTNFSSNKDVQSDDIINIYDLIKIIKQIDFQ